MATCKMSRLLPDMSAHHRMPRKGAVGWSFFGWFAAGSWYHATNKPSQSRNVAALFRISATVRSHVLGTRLLFPASANYDHKTQHAASSTHVAAPRCSRNIHSSGWPCGCTMGPFHPPTPFFLGSVLPNPNARAFPFYFSTPGHERISGRFIAEVQCIRSTP